MPKISYPRNEATSPNDVTTASGLRNMIGNCFPRPQERRGICPKVTADWFPRSKGVLWQSRWEHADAHTLLKEWGSQRTHYHHPEGLRTSDRAPATNHVREDLTIGERDGL